jgi:hypothetical protein
MPPQPTVQAITTQVATLLPGEEPDIFEDENDARRPSVLLRKPEVPGPPSGRPAVSVRCIGLNCHPSRPRLL